MIERDVQRERVLERVCRVSLLDRREEEEGQVLELFIE